MEPRTEGNVPVSRFSNNRTPPDTEASDRGSVPDKELPLRSNTLKFFARARPTKKLSGIVPLNPRLAKSNVYPSKAVLSKREMEVDSAISAESCDGELWGVHSSKLQWASGQSRHDDKLQPPL